MACLPSASRPSCLRASSYSLMACCSPWQSAHSAVVGLIMLRAFPRFVARFLSQLERRPVPSFFAGVVALVATIPGSIGPALTDIKSKYPDRSELVAILVDATKRNPLTVMPPFGRNRILNDKEINAIVDFLQTL